MGRRDDRPYFSSEDPRVPFDEMQLACVIAMAGMQDQIMHKFSRTKTKEKNWTYVEYEIDRFFSRGSMRRASNILRRGYHFKGLRRP